MTLKSRVKSEPSASPEHDEAEDDKGVPYLPLMVRLVRLARRRP